MNGNNTQFALWFRDETSPGQVMTVYDFYPASGAHVSLDAGLVATQASYQDHGGVWGTKLTITDPVGPNHQTAGPVLTADFVYTSHVNVVASTT